MINFINMGCLMLGVNELSTEEEIAIIDKIIKLKPNIRKIYLGIVNLGLLKLQANSEQISIVKCGEEINVSVQGEDFYINNIYSLTGHELIESQLAFTISYYDISICSTMSIFKFNMTSGTTNPYSSVIIDIPHDDGLKPNIILGLAEVKESDKVQYKHYITSICKILNESHMTIYPEYKQVIKKLLGLM